MRNLILTLVFILTSYLGVYCAVIYYDDPIAVGIGARPISMGKAFVAVADDANAIFLNPAGLSSQKAWIISTMNANLLDVYQYLMFCGVNPTPVGVFGIGYVSSRVGDIAVSGGGTSDFYNQALVLSYGRYVGDVMPDFLGKNPNVHAGATLKYYQKGFTGSVNASGSGYNADIALLYSPEKWMSYGLNLQNVIFGSRVSGDFDPEEMPFIAKIGGAFNWLEHDVTFALDKDMFIGRANVPWPTHFGAEWRVHPNLSLRAGYDQVASSADSGDLVNNTTFGVGFNYAGVKIDLAYMQNYAQTNLASNVISLTFFSEPVNTEEAPPPKKKVRP